MLARRTIYFILLAFVVVLAACGDKVALQELPRSVEYFGRAREFMSMAVVLLNEGRPFWGQSLRAFYYAAFSVARAKDLDGFLKDDKSVHDKVWGQSKVDARSFFAETLRSFRNKWDYEVRTTRLGSVEDDMRIVCDNAPAAIVVLLDDARDAIDRQHRHCADGAPTRCKHCLRVKSVTCARSDALALLSDFENDATAYLRRQIPAVLGRSPQRTPPS